MKKILCFIDSLGPGGAQRQIIGLAAFLKEKGYEVTVACYYDNLFYADKLVDCGVPYVFWEKAKKTKFRLWHVARYFSQMKPDAVISFLETPSICACVAKLFNHRFKLIVSERNTTQHTGRNEKIRFNLFRLADYVVPNAFAQADYISNTFPFLSKKVVTIPNFVDLNLFTPPIQRKRKENPEIIVAATIWPSKNTYGFIDAVDQLRNTGRRFHISWYGKDSSQMEYFNKCQKKIEDLGLDGFIELKEKTKNIREKYQKADYFCLPSFYEGTPNVICEAMACGLPVVCSEVCDNSRYVKDGVNGILFNPRDISSISSALDRLLSLSDTDYVDYCNNGRKRAELMMSKEKFLESYIQLIEK